jgi:hypothetical protein
MLGPNLFFKRTEMKNINAAYPNELNVMNKPSGMYRPITNMAVRRFDGHPRYGFQTRLDHEMKPLPSAPAVVGGNVNWTKSKVTPATQYLHSVLSGGRPMNPAPALGSTLRLGEPTLNSIHTTY